jgi:hypothetical protein
MHHILFVSHYWINMNSTCTILLHTYLKLSNCDADVIQDWLWIQGNSSKKLLKYIPFLPKFLKLGSCKLYNLSTFDLDSIFRNFLSPLSTSSQLFQWAPISSECSSTFQKVESIVQNFANNMRKLALGEDWKQMLQWFLSRDANLNISSFNVGIINHNITCLWLRKHPIPHINERCLSLNQIHSTRFETHLLNANTMFSPLLFSHCAPCWMITLSPQLKEFERFLNLNFIFSSFSILYKWCEI